jgi:hypothetical protein
VTWTATMFILGIALVLLPLLYVASVGERSTSGATSWPTDAREGTGRRQVRGQVQGQVQGQVRGPESLVGPPPDSGRRLAG